MNHGRVLDFLKCVGLTKLGVGIVLRMHMRNPPDLRKIAGFCAISKEKPVSSITIALAKIKVTFQGVSPSLRE